MSARDGGPAFPRNPDKGEGNDFGSHGASLRDFFAAAQLSGVMGSAEGLGGMPDAERASLMQSVAKLIYEMADAMIAERAK